jgi:flavin reductase (DIM6/NTAB) family NADH-FMN oxidoreductase RutF
MTDVANDQQLRTIDLAGMPGRDGYFLLNSLVVPRPIAWVGTVREDGVRNLAPHSFFTVACDRPPMLMFVSLGEKDTVRNIRATGSFTINVVDGAMAEAMNVTAANAPHGIDELDLARLQGVPGERVAAPRVLGAPATFECEVERIVELGDAGDGSPRSFAVVGNVVLLHVAERVLDERGRVDPAALDAVARMGASDYATTRDRFVLRRPTYDDLVSGAPAPTATPPVD